MSSTRPMHLTCAVMNVHPHAGLERSVVIRQPQVGDARVEAIGDRQGVGCRHDVAAGDLVLVEPRDVERHALACRGLLDRLGVHLHAPHATRLA